MNAVQIETEKKILNAGISLFAQNGLDGVSVRDIAQKAGVNISLISYYFDGKEGLYRHCIDSFGAARLNAAKELLSPPKSKADFKSKFSDFTIGMLSTYGTEPELVKMVLRELEMDREICADIIEKRFHVVGEMLEKFFAVAIRKKYIRKGLEPKMIAHLLFGTICHTGRAEKLMRRFHGQDVRCPKVQKKISTHITEIFLKGIS